MQAYEEFIADKTRFDSKELLIKTYEDLLLYERQQERGALNRARQIAYDKNRPPQDGWYMMKSSGFEKELYRNRVALKPNNLNAVYLANLKDDQLY